MLDVSCTGITGPRGEVRVNKTTISSNRGLETWPECFCKKSEMNITSSLRIQERSESLDEEPVAQTARMVPSSCSCTEGSLETVPPGAFSPSIHLDVDNVLTGQNPTQWLNKAWLAVTKRHVICTFSYYSDYHRPWVAEEEQGQGDLSGWSKKPVVEFEMAFPVQMIQPISINTWFSLSHTLKAPSTYRAVPFFKPSINFCWSVLCPETTQVCNVEMSILQQKKQTPPCHLNQGCLQCPISLTLWTGPH